VSQLRGGAEMAYEAKARRLLNQNPRRRDPAAVADAVTDLAQARGQLEEALGILTKAGPYRTELVENARNACKDYTEQQVRLFELYERCLREGENWSEKDEQDLKQQDQRVKDAHDRWHKFLGPD
jgi:hypothetical protein